MRVAVADFRRWFRGMVRDLLAADGHPDAERTADLLLVLRDGWSWAATWATRRSWGG